MTTNSTQSNKTAKVAKFLLCLAVFAVIVATKSPTVHAGGISPAQVITLVNSDRQKQGVAQLAVSKGLTTAAQHKAEDMLQKGYFAHVSPEGKAPWDFIEDAGYDYRYAGENLAINYTNAQEQQKAWMNSPLHRKNILNAQYEEIGVAVAQGIMDGHNTTITVQEFGTRMEKVATVSSSQVRATVAGSSVVATKEEAIATFLAEVKNGNFLQGFLLTLAGWVLVLGVCIVLVIVDLSAIAYKRHFH